MQVGTIVVAVYDAEGNLVSWEETPILPEWDED